MKKILKISTVILVNIILIAGVLCISEFTVYMCENIRIKLSGQDSTPLNKYAILPEHFRLFLDYFPNPDTGFGRAPSGLQYEKPPVTVFGCSFAFGYRLNREETFSHLLSEQTKRPVYDRSASGWGLQQMLMQVRDEKFYEHVPKSEYVIYIMINDHFRRLYIPSFMSSNMLHKEYCPRYKFDGEKLIPKDEPSFVKDFFKMLYTTQKIEHFYVNNFIIKDNNCEKYLDFAAEHFIETKNELDKHWGNTKFIVLFYQPFYKEELLKEKLEKNGFQVIRLEDIVDFDINSPEYLQENFHPTAKAWEVITPAFIKEAGIE